MRLDRSNTDLCTPAAPGVRLGTSRAVVSGISLLLLVAFALHPGVAGGTDRARTNTDTGAAQRAVVQTPRHVEQRVVRKQTERPAVAGAFVLLTAARLGDGEPVVPTADSPLLRLLPAWCTGLPPPEGPC